MRFRLLIIIVCLLLLGCNVQDLPATGTTTPRPAETAQVIRTPTTPVSPTQGDSLQMTPSTSPPAASGMQNLIAKAMEDLAQRLSISRSQINLVEAKGVVWPDSSLGCPQPGMAYAQVLTPGYLFILSADDIEFEYHASRGTEVIYCENPNPPIPGTPDDV